MEESVDESSEYESDPENEEVIELDKSFIKI